MTSYGISMPRWVFSAFGARHVHWFIFIQIHIKHSHQLYSHNFSTLNQLRFVRIWVCEIRLPWPKCSGVHTTCSGFQDPELTVLKSIDVYLVALSVNRDWGFRFIIAFLAIRFWIRLAVVNCGGWKKSYLCIYLHHFWWACITIQTYLTKVHKRYACSITLVCNSQLNIYSLSQVHHTPHYPVVSKVFSSCGSLNTIYTFQYIYLWQIWQYYSISVSIHWCSFHQVQIKWIPTCSQLEVSLHVSPLRRAC